MTPPTPATTEGVRWGREVPAQKWTNFYIKVLSRAKGNVPPHKLEERRAALRELGLGEDMEAG